MQQMAEHRAGRASSGFDARSRYASSPDREHERIRDTREPRENRRDRELFRDRDRYINCATAVLRLHSLSPLEIFFSIICASLSRPLDPKLHPEN